MARIDIGVARVLEHHKGGAEAEIHGNRAELPFEIGHRIDFDAPGLERFDDIAIGKNHPVSHFPAGLNMPEAYVRTHSLIEICASVACPSQQGDSAASSNGSMVPYSVPQCWDRVLLSLKKAASVREASALVDLDVLPGRRMNSHELRQNSSSDRSP
jgi:hypothetical protein